MIEALLVVYLGCMICLFAYSLAQLHLTLIHRWQRTAPAAAGPGELPFVTVQLPIYNERYVAARMLDCAGALDYPRDRFEIQVLDDSTDDTPAIVARKLSELAARGLRVAHLRRAQRTGYKAGALHDALPRAAGELIAIFDADFCPAPDALRKAVDRFADARVAAVQMRWTFLNEEYSLLTRLQGFVLRAHFGVEQPARFRRGLFANFNGTAGLWRRAAIEDGGGWRADTVTEDLDLSYRVQFRGWRIEFLEDQPCPSELPVEMDAFRSQQTRWMKGGAQCARLHLGRVLRSRLPLVVRIHACAHLLSSSVYLLVFGTLLLSVPLSVFGGSITRVYSQRYAPWFFLTIPVAAFLLHESQDRRYGFVRFWAFLVGWFVFSLGMALHNAAAAARGWLGYGGEFVRTPKYGIVGARGDWSRTHYARRRFPAGASLEAVLMIFLLAGLAGGFARGDFSFYPVQLMGLAGLGWVIGLSLWHARRAPRQLLAVAAAHSPQSCEPAK